MAMAMPPFLCQFKLVAMSSYRNLFHFLSCSDVCFVNIKDWFSGLDLKFVTWDQGELMQYPI